MDRSLLRNTAPLRILCIRFCMFRYNIDTLYNRSILFYKDFQNTPSLSFIFSCIYVNGIPFLYM